MLHEITTIYPLTESSFSGPLSSLLLLNAVDWGAKKAAFQDHSKLKEGIEVLQDGLPLDSTGEAVGILQML